MELRRNLPLNPKIAALLIMTSLLLLSAAFPCSSATVHAEESQQAMKTAAVAEAEAEYDVDYRGPETHPAVFPPPGHFRGRTPFRHR
ncbi:hypothetical protein LINGRAHAP2_LOCUS35553 [Linum grandiflorum]